MKASQLRVAMFSGNYNYVRDGANQALNRLARHLLDRDVALRVYSPTVAEPAFPPTGDLVSVPAYGMPGGRGEYKLARGLTAKTRADLEAFRPNVVHVSAPDILGHRALSWGRKQGIATLASLHTRFETYPQYYGIGFLEPVARGLSKRFYDRADQVMVPGRGMAELLREWGVASPIGIWSRGVDHQRFNPAMRDVDWRRSIGIGDDEVAVSFLGRLVLEKGLDVFSDVATELQRRGVKHRILVIGEGPARDWFAERVPHAVFAGFQAGDDLGRAVASMDVFFNPSITETFGNVTLEAMAAGVPVVAARATGAVGLVDDRRTGYLVPPGDTPAYADAIARLCEDANMRWRMGLAGHDDAQHYRWDSANQAVLDAYLRIVKG